MPSTEGAADQFPLTLTSGFNSPLQNRQQLQRLDRGRKFVKLLKFRIRSGHLVVHRLEPFEPGFPPKRVAV